MNKYVYPAIFKKEKKGYSIFFPDLEGCQTEGDTMDECFYMAEDALSLYLFDLEEDKKEIAKPSNPLDVKTEKDEFVTLIKCDMEEYRRKYDSKAVKKTLTIPNWLNTLSENANINFSNVLQNALIEKLNLDKKLHK